MKPAQQKDFVQRFEEENLNGLSIHINVSEAENLLKLQSEWMEYRKLMKQTPVVRSLELGEGVFSHLSPQALQRLLQFIFKSSIIHPANEFRVPKGEAIESEYFDAIYSAGFSKAANGVSQHHLIINLGSDKDHVSCLHNS